MSRDSLPDYQSPPVSEVVFSVEYLPSPNWRNAYAGRYWETVKKEYPKAQDAAALASQIERFDAASQIPLQAPAFHLVTSPEVRHWFQDDSGNYLIQLQRDRFITNWRKISDTDPYPRYDLTLRPHFLKEFARFDDYLHANNMAPLSIQQCELTYVNFIIMGEGWNTFPEAVELFSLLRRHGSTGFLPAPESLNVTGSFRIPDEEARLHFQIVGALRQTDMKEGIQVNLTARGRPRSGKKEDISAFMDLGREWIVRGFTDLTSDKAHKIWGRKP